CPRRSARTRRPTRTTPTSTRRRRLPLPLPGPRAPARRAVPPRGPPTGAPRSWPRTVAVAVRALLRATRARRRLISHRPTRCAHRVLCFGAGVADWLACLTGSADSDAFILVKLMDIRKEVQCPICLGIIRKTRTVMECLHRFCRDCIDKSMRLGNNECPACRTHCKSRRSLRDDPNFDALILALYPDIDKYEEEELAFGEEEKTRNKKIQDSIAETFRRQTEALVKKRSNAKAIASTRKTRGSMRTKKRGRTSSPDNAPTDIDDDEREENGNDGSKESSSVDDRSPDVKMKRARRWPVPRSSPAKTIGSVDSSYEENDDLGGARDILATSPLRGEMLAWGKNGTRSQTRHGSAGGSSGRMVKGGRVAKLVDHLRNADEFDTKFNLYLALTPLDGQSIPKLEKSYLSCQPTFSVSHLCQFVALQLSREAQEVEIYFRKNSINGS
uniref:RING-type domain-containing protein n=1 Tax=Aegilops tauschii subsp. strangulata TaxID=200361 RepID=A0A452ZFR2_AEGTS